MNKKELVTSIAEKVGLSKIQAGLVIDAFISSVIATLKEGGSVRIPGFGSFEVMRREASKGVNPLTREVIDIPARNVPKFKPGNFLKESVNNAET
ncbi:MAG: DNA-binding protein HU-beta [Candidatus Tokpelaia sp. JSC161]|jgi:DNA-binding protein HU-beta|nr:MAG: DNA-binding protein HU-beta [Candidatus Tokpelaia sp. JSC161]